MNLLDMTADLNELAKNAGHVSEHAIERNRRASAMAVADLSKVLAKQALSPMMAEAGESSTDMEDMFAKIQADAEKRFHHHPAPLPSTLPNDATTEATTEATTGVTSVGSEHKARTGSTSEPQLTALDESDESVEGEEEYDMGEFDEAALGGEATVGEEVEETPVVQQQPAPGNHEAVFYDDNKTNTASWPPTQQPRQPQQPRQRHRRLPRLRPPQLHLQQLRHR